MRELQLTGKSPIKIPSLGAWWLLIGLWCVQATDATSGPDDRLQHIPLQQNQPQITLTSHFQMLLHQSGYNANTVRQIPPHQWQSSPGHVISLGPSNKTHWYRLSLDNTKTQGLERLIELSRPYLDIHIYRHGQPIRRYPTTE